MKRWIPILIGCWSFLSIPFITAHAMSDRVCKQWYQKKKFVEASRCFYSLVQQTMAQKKVTPEQHESIGTWLQNATLSLRKAANATSSAANAAYLREQAIQYLDLYIKNKFYETDTQRRAAEIQRTGLYDKVGYATLTITTSSTKNQIKVTGFRFEKADKGTWSQTVRPGSYTVLVSEPGGVTKAKVVEVKPRQPQVLNISLNDSPGPVGGGPVISRPVEPARTVPAATWGLTAAGGASAVTGVILFITGMKDRDEANDVNRKAQTNGNFRDTQKLLELQNASNRQIVAAWILSSVGVAALVTGVIIYAVQKPKPTATSQKTETHAPLAGSHHNQPTPLPARSQVHFQITP